MLVWCLLPCLAASEEEPKVGLVLGGGGVKGLAHIPVLKCLDDLGIRVDFIAGTSAGGVVGALYAIGYSGRDLERLTSQLDWEDLLSDRPPRSLQPFLEKKLEGRYQLDFFPGKGMPRLPQALISGEKLFLLFSRLTFPFAGERDFDLLPIPFRCTAVDIVTGKPVLLRSGPLAKAMRATMAIPGIFSPVEWNDFLLIDGGATNNLPIDVVLEMGADIIIAVDVSSPLDKKAELLSADKIISQTLTSVYLQQQEEKMKRVDILIYPDMKGLGSMDFFFPDKLARIIKNSEAAVRESVPKLKSLKEKYRLERPEVSETKVAKDKRGEENPSIGKIHLRNVTVSGNTHLTPAFITGQLGMKPGETVDDHRLSQQIMNLYALGYFETIHYELFPAGENKADLELLIKEHPRGKFRLGLRYDNLHNLAAAVGAYFNNLPFSGWRIENELTVAGLTRYHSRISYPSASLSLPIYPFLHVGYKSIPTRFYRADGDLLSSYRDRSWSFGAGIGLLVDKWFQAEISYEAEATDVEKIGIPADSGPFQGLKSNLRRLSIGASIDTLDSVWLPEDGLFLRARYEGSYPSLDSDASYESFEASLDFYQTFSKKHTLRFYGYGGTSSGDIPFYKFFNQGYPSTFVGMQYDQLFGNRMKIIRGEYRYALSYFIRLVAMANVAFDFKQRWPEFTFSTDHLWGVGAGITIHSPAGPLELIYSMGSKSLLQPEGSQSVVYLVLGAKF